MESNWYHFSSLCLFAYGCTAGAAIEKVMYIFHPRVTYKTCYIPRDGDYDFAVLMREGSYFQLTYKVTKAYGPPGVKTIKEITRVATHEQDEYTPVNFDNGVWAATIPCTVPTRMDDWVFHRAELKEMQLNHTLLTAEQRQTKRDVMLQSLDSI